VQKAGIVDVDYHEPDLVDVTGKHDSWAAVRVHHSGCVSGYVGRNRVAERFCFLAPYPGRDDLEARRTGGIEKSLEKTQRVLVHAARSAKTADSSR